VNLIFTTLWSKISPAHEWDIEHQMSDFHVIRYNKFRFSSVQYNQLHNDCLEFLLKEINNTTTKKTIVVTHHVPTFLNYPEQYKGSVLNEGFAVELFDFIEKSKVDYWIYGHHHQNIPSFKIGNTELQTNQLGYVKYGENKGFSFDRIIEL